MSYFHTCATTHGRKFVSENAPFLSRANGPTKWQWLSQGYYFWPDEDYFAHIWGRDAYKDDYAIIKCEINLSANVVLNLASNITHSLYFKNLIELYIKKIKEVDPDAKPTVSTVIEHFRLEAQKNKDIFPFEAIQAADCSSDAPKIQFTPNCSNYMITIPRLQLCLFQSSHSAITSKVICHFS
ncbi:hypothetical protein [Providencia sp. PROV124]|uniref:hypothetical protein n=1 Tax=Providencia sp. PROV124 TaxID=2949835 RepID=UPI00234AAB38|nr:hypothetical protein [Providencia sp. PROV124]